jgi:hypothetical protein
LADLVNIGINEPGQPNASFKLGLMGADGFAVGPATVQYYNSTGSPVIIHKAVPVVTVENPGSRLGVLSPIHRMRVSALGGPIGLYRLTYLVSTSMNIMCGQFYTVLSGCFGDCGGISIGTQLSNKLDGQYYEPSTKSVNLDISSTQSHGKYFLPVSQGATAVIDLYSTCQLSAMPDNVMTRLLGDSSNTSQGEGSPVSHYGVLAGGNFVWSDLHLSENNSASTLNANQWYNGYLVNGLAPITAPITIGE